MVCAQLLEDALTSDTALEGNLKAIPLVKIDFDGTSAPSIHRGILHAELHALVTPGGARLVHFDDGPAAFVCTSLNNGYLQFDDSPYLDVADTESSSSDSWKLKQCGTLPLFYLAPTGIPKPYLLGEWRTILSVPENDGAALGQETRDSVTESDAHR